MFVFFRDRGYVERMSAAGSSQNRIPQFESRHGCHRRQKSPLIWIRNEAFIYKNAKSLFAGMFLQGEQTLGAQRNWP